MKQYFETAEHPLFWNDKNLRSVRLLICEHFSTFHFQFPDLKPAIVLAKLSKPNWDGFCMQRHPSIIIWNNKQTYECKKNPRNCGPQKTNSYMKSNPSCLLQRQLAFPHLVFIQGGKITKLHFMGRKTWQLSFSDKKKKVLGMKTSIKTPGAFSQIPILIMVLIFPISKPILLRLIMT